MKLDVQVCDVQGDHSNPGKYENAMAVAVSYDPCNSTVVKIACDDKSLVQLDSEGEVATKHVNLASHVSSMSWFPPIGKSSSDLLAAACSDGTLCFMHAKNGLLEKKIRAHEGAATCVEWNMDGSSIATAGEDGEVKIWSRNGNLRTKLASYGMPIYCLSWGRDNESIVVATQNKLSILGTQRRTKRLQWEVNPREKGVVLAVDWNSITDRIICGGEDCCYRIFDSSGILLFASSPHEHVVTSLAWRPNGKAFVVGSHNSIRLCDQRGWERSHEILTVGSIMDLLWSPDGTQFAAACGGAVLLSRITHQTIEYRGATAELVHPNKIVLMDKTLSGDVITEDVEFLNSERIVEFGMSSNHLVVCTTAQCYIYSLPLTGNTPNGFDLKKPPTMIIMSSKVFLIVDAFSGVSVFNYDGRYVSSPRYEGLQLLAERNISLSNDAVAIIDHTDNKVIHLVEASTGKPIGDGVGKLTHEIEVSTVALSQNAMSLQDRRLVFVDKKNDLYISPLTKLPGVGGRFAVQRLASHVDSVAWNDESDALAAIADSRLVTWFYPNALYVDRDLLLLASEMTDGNEFGRSPEILSFHGTTISVLCHDGTLLRSSAPPHHSIAYSLAESKRWVQAVRLCRSAQSLPLWATLAGLAIQHRELETAEVALGAMREVEKLEYIQHMRSIPSEEGRNAEMAMYCKCPEEAVSILLQASPPQVYRAIKCYLRLFRWDDALDVAARRNQHVEVVLWYRKKYLEENSTHETNPHFTEWFEKVLGRGDDALDDRKILAERRRAKLHEEGRGADK